MRIKKYISWTEILTRLTNVVGDNTFKDYRYSIYGVPKGGMILTAFIPKNLEVNIVTNPLEANIILDDIEDSGRTREYYKKINPTAKFISLYQIEEFTKIDGEFPWLVFPWEKDHPAGEETFEQNIVRILQGIGEDPNREGLKDTPERVIKSYKELFKGYSMKFTDFLTTFENEDNYDQIILLKDIELYSMCEHHMLPFYGKAHVAYVPDKRIVGLSKLARLVDMFARRLQIQERIGQEVTQHLMNNSIVGAKGAACIIEAKHTCMCMRGVNKQHSKMITSSMEGVFMENPSAKEELMQLIRG